MRIRAEIKPGSREEGISKQEGVFRIKVKEPAVEGRANRAAIKILADYFKVAASRINLIAGGNGRKKVFEIR